MASHEQYEGLFVLDGDLSEAALTSVQQQISEQITKLGGTIERQEPWGKRRLAYRVRKHRDGCYWLVVCRLPAAAVAPFETWCALQEPLLRRLIVRLPKQGLQPVGATTNHGQPQ